MAEAKFIDDLKRTHYCGQLRGTDVGQEVVLFGWVHSKRHHGGCVFADLRDREGIAQVVFDPESNVGSRETREERQFAEAMTIAGQIRPEWVLGVRGVVVSRGQNINRKLPTGEVEVHVLQARVFNVSQTPPFEVVDELDTREELRLQYRYLDLRRSALQRVLRLRHRMNQVARRCLSAQGCIELETPMMVKYTPGGARNFVTPSRLAAGKFYALAESPQLFKQLFMVAGFDRYFQIVKCFRDEDFRLDRQPEFTQVDIELSFVNQDDVFAVVERLLFEVVREVCGMDLRDRYPDAHFPRMSFDESMRRFGNDKPDLRFDLEHVDLTGLVLAHQGGGVPMLAEMAGRYARGELRRDVPGEIVKAMRVPAHAKLSRSDVDKLEALAKSMGAPGLGRVRVGADGAWTQTPMAKTISAELRLAVNEATQVQEGDWLLLEFGRAPLVHTVMANLRLHLGRRLGLIPERGHAGDLRFLWVVDPPLFELDEETGRWVAAHHAFTRPHDEHIALIESDPALVQCYRYDLVLNGFEIAGGSIRLHDPNVQQMVFRALGIDADRAHQMFGFLLEALRFGAPPHGGIALGWDRVAMILSEAESLRDVIPFPKTARGADLMTDAPSALLPEQLRELHIQLVEPSR